MSLASALLAWCGCARPRARPADAAAAAAAAAAAGAADAPTATDPLLAPCVHRVAPTLVSSATVGSLLERLRADMIAVAAADAAPYTRVDAPADLRDTRADGALATDLRAALPRAGLTHSWSDG